MRLVIIFLLCIFIAIEIDVINQQHYIINKLKDKNKELTYKK